MIRSQGIRNVPDCSVRRPSAKKDAARDESEARRGVQRSMDYSLCLNTKGVHREDERLACSSVSGGSRRQASWS